VTSAHPGAVEPVGKWDAGAWGTPNCCCVHGPETLDHQAPPGGAVGVEREEEAVERLIERCAGLDVHKASVTATVRVPGDQGGRRTETRTFRATTAGLVLLGDWLASFGATVVGMESTGVYWKPVYYLLEDAFEVWLLNAQHLKNVPGRKTDVADSVWICQLVEHGLVRPSFVPPRPIRELRDLTRYRKAVLAERTREVQRLHKVLEDAGTRAGECGQRPAGRLGPGDAGGAGGGHP